MKSMISLLMLISAACAKTDKVTFDVGFEERPGYTPWQLGDWPHGLFMFDDGRCTHVRFAPDAASLDYIPQARGRVTAVACESLEGLSFSHTEAGAASSEYYVTVTSADMLTPQIWMDETAVGSNGNFVMEPVTVSAAVALTSAPADLTAVNLKIPNVCDILFLDGGRTETLAAPRNASVTIGRDEQRKDFSFLPMAEPAQGWELEYTLQMEGGRKTEGRVAIREGISRGEQIEVDFDFSGYASDHTYTVEYRQAEYGADNWITTRCEGLIEPPEPTGAPYYEVRVMCGGVWTPLEVRPALCSDSPRYHSRIWNDWDNSKKLRDTMYFVNFTHEFDAPVRVRVKKLRGGAFGSAEVRPTPYGISPVDIGGNTVEFELPSWEKRKVSVEFDGDRYHNLFILPNRPDTDKPSPDNPNVIYFGKGEHNPGKIVLRANQTLYIDEGAVVYGKVEVAGDNVKIAGYGILSGAKLRHWGDKWSMGEILIECNRLRVPALLNLTISGITIIDSPSWTLSVYNMRYVDIDNINMICWILNGDGIDLCSVRDAEVRDCFIRTYDDCITLKVRHNANPVSDVRDVLVANCLIWSDFARGIVFGPEAGLAGDSRGEIRDCTVRDCIVLEHPYRAAGSEGEGAGISISQYPSPEEGSEFPASPMYNLRVRNIIFDNIQKSGRPIYIYQKRRNGGKCSMYDVLFENIEILDGRGIVGPSVNIVTNGNSITGMTFRNLTHNGVAITEPGSFFSVSNSGGTADITIE